MDRPTLELWRDRGMDLQLLEDDTRSALSLVHFAHLTSPSPTTPPFPCFPPLTAPTTSALSPTRSSATLSPGSPSTTPRAPPRCPGAGAGSSTRRRSSSSASTSPAATWRRSLACSHGGSRTSPLSVKGVRHLVLVNRPWPLNVDLPATFFGMATLTSLFLGLWH
ncbi:hypothetical protein SEVIR_5G031150v4 [Setaria viridis]